MKDNKSIRDYTINGKINIDSIVDEWYNYIYAITKNNTTMQDEDIEEIISDVFIALWKNSSYLSQSTNIKHYLSGITRNVIKNKYKTIQINNDILDYENEIIDYSNIEKIVEENEQNRIIVQVLKNMKTEESKIFTMYYYEAKKIKEIAQELSLSNTNVKVKLYRIRKIVKKSLKNGGYDYDK